MPTDPVEMKEGRTIVQKQAEEISHVSMGISGGSPVSMGMNSTGIRCNDWAIGGKLLSLARG